MRNQRKSSDPSDRQGPLAALMRAAEPLDQLSAAERERIKHRLRSELAPRRPLAKLRLLTTMAGVGLLLGGGVAVAGRWGLIRWPGMAQAPVSVQPEIAQPQRAPRGHARAVVPAAVDESASAPSPEPAPLAQAPVSEREPVQALPAAQPADTKKAPSAPSTRARRASPEAQAQEPARPSAPRQPPPAGLEPPRPLPLPPLPPPVSVAVTTSPSLAMATPDETHFHASKPAPAAPNPTPTAQDLLGQALRSLRRGHDPAGALEILARHAGLFPDSALAGERIQLEVEALLALGRHAEALTRLDGMALDAIPRAAERHVVRGELRARVRRWNEAAADFEQALAHAQAGSPWHERALWGRALARSHGGDGVGSTADMRLYLQIYPQGRFAHEATRSLAEKP